LFFVLLEILVFYFLCTSIYIYIYIYMPPAQAWIRHSRIHPRRHAMGVCWGLLRPPIWEYAPALRSAPPLEECAPNPNTPSTPNTPHAYNPWVKSSSHMTLFVLLGVRFHNPTSQKSNPQPLKPKSQRYGNLFEVFIRCVCFCFKQLLKLLYFGICQKRKKQKQK
jgi:hypothetical protein